MVASMPFDEGASARPARAHARAVRKQREQVRASRARHAPDQVRGQGGALGSPYTEAVLDAVDLRQGSRLLYVGEEDALLSDLRGAFGEDAVVAVSPDHSARARRSRRLGSRDALLEEATLDGVVWSWPVGRLGGDLAIPLMREARRSLRIGGRIALVQRLLPSHPVLKVLVSPALSVMGVRYSARELHGMLERAGFWECGVSATFDGGWALVQGELFSDVDDPDTQVDWDRDPPARSASANDAPLGPVSKLASA